MKSQHHFAIMAELSNAIYVPIYERMRSWQMRIKALI